MAYEKNEIEDVVGVIDVTDSTKIRITKIGNDNKIESFDIRQWYKTQADPTYKSTKKGVRISKENLSKLIGVLLKEVDEDVLEEVKENYNIEVRRD